MEKSNQDIGVGIIENLLHEVGAENDHCISCNTCRFECPVNMATSSLQPRLLVRMVNLGLLEELINLPEVWYCLQCNQCNRVCPMEVKPAALIKHIRHEAIKQRLIDDETINRLRELQVHLQRVRSHAVRALLEGKMGNEEAIKWSEWSHADGFEDEQPIRIKDRIDRRIGQEQLGAPNNFEACMTCRECSTTCPICHELTTYDPLQIFRKVSFGLMEEVIQHPMIWLCLACESCTSACRQSVRGHALIKDLKVLANKRKMIPPDFELTWNRLNQRILMRYREEIDRVLDLAVEKQ